MSPEKSPNQSVNPQAPPNVRYSELELKILECGAIGFIQGRFSSGYQEIRDGVGGWHYAPSPYEYLIKITRQFWPKKRSPEKFEKIDKKFWTKPDTDEPFLLGDIYTQWGKRVWGWGSGIGLPCTYENSNNSAREGYFVPLNLPGNFSPLELIIAIQSLTDSDWIYIGKESGDTYLFDEENQTFYKPAQ